MIVEASLSEPHTSETACARVCVCLFVWTDRVFQILFMRKKTGCNIHNNFKMTAKCEDLETVCGMT